MGSILIDDIAKRTELLDRLSRRRIVLRNFDPDNPDLDVIRVCIPHDADFGLVIRLVEELFGHRYRMVWGNSKPAYRKYRLTDEPTRVQKARIPRWLKTFLFGTHWDEPQCLGWRP